MRRFLDWLYLSSGALAAVFVAAICTIVLCQVALNALDIIAVLLGYSAPGFVIPSYAEFAGLFLAAATFFALAYSLRKGAHIRVSLLIGHLSGSRRKAFELWLDGAGVMFRSDGPSNFSELAGQSIGVRAGTTTEETLKRSLAKDSIEAEVVSVKDHGDGLKQLETGKLSAYFADQAILIYLAATSKSTKGLRVSKRFFTHEPYALALPRGDSDFRLAVDRGLSRIYRSSAIEKILGNSFGTAKVSDLVKALFLISALPE